MDLLKKVEEILVERKVQLHKQKLELLRASHHVKMTIG